MPESLFGLSQSDVSILKRVVASWRGGTGATQKGQRRNRFPFASGGGGGNGSGDYATLIKTIPAATINGSTGETTYGYAEAAAIEITVNESDGTWTSAPVLVPNPDHDPEDEESEEYVPKLLPAINPRGYPIRASVTIPINMPGRYLVRNGNRVFACYPEDLAGTPGFSLGSVVGGSNVDDPDLQIIFHPGGSRQFTMDAELCAEPTEEEEEE